MDHQLKIRPGLKFLIKSTVLYTVQYAESNRDLIPVPKWDKLQSKCPSTATNTMG